MLTLITPATLEPVTLAELKEQAEVHSSITRHDAKLTRYITAARMAFEIESGYQLAEAEYLVTYAADSIPCLFNSLRYVLPLRPVSAVTEVTAGETTLEETTDYTVETDLQGFATVRLVAAQSDLSIKFTAGFPWTEGQEAIEPIEGQDAIEDDPETPDVDESQDAIEAVPGQDAIPPVSTCPAILKHAVLTLAAHMYRNRDAFNDNNVEQRNVPLAYRSIVAMYRVA